MIELRNMETNTRIIRGETTMEVYDHYTDKTYEVLIEWGAIPGSYTLEEYYISDVKVGDKHYTDNQMEKMDKDWPMKRAGIYSIFLSYKPYKPPH